MIQSGYKELEINAAGSTSNIMNDFGLAFVDDLGGYSASEAICQQTTTVVEEKTLSVANWADFGTKMGQLNISNGTIAVFRNGQIYLATRLFAH